MNVEFFQHGLRLLKRCMFFGFPRLLAGFWDVGQVNVLHDGNIGDLRLNLGQLLKLEKIRGLLSFCSRRPFLFLIGIEAAIEIDHLTHPSPIRLTINPPRGVKP